MLRNVCINFSSLLSSIGLRKNFIPRFSRNFCGPFDREDCDEAIDNPRLDLLTNLVINETTNENDQDFTRNVISAYATSAVNGIIRYFVTPRVQSLSNSNRLCIQRIFEQESSQIEQLTNHLIQIRRAISALKRLRNFLRKTAVPQILKVNLTNSCVASFISLRCRACVEDLPETCRGACNALVYGCLAPYRDGLRAQFNLLWNATGQIVNTTNNIIRTTGRLSRTLFGVNISDARNLTQMVSTCVHTIMDYDSC